MNIRLRRSVLGLTALVVAASGLVGAGTGSASATSAIPPYEPDPGSIGALTLYNASGSVVTGGNINDAPFAAYVQAGTPGRVGDTKATLFGYLPKSGVPTGAFSGEQLTASTTYPNASAPAALKASPLPLVSLTSADETVATLISDFPNTATDAYQGLYQLRLKTSGVGQAAGVAYDSADIQVTGSTWTLVYSAAPASTYTPLTPCRIFDTRSGSGNCFGAAATSPGAIGAGGKLSVKVAGVGGVPDNATAVVLNLTAVGATASTFVTAWPDGTSQPTVSSLNVAGPAATPNLAIVPIGKGGVVDFFNAKGSINLIADVAGYYSSDPTGSLYTTTGPCRLFDTRSSGLCTGAPTLTPGKIPAAGTLAVKVTGAGGVPTNATAVVLNLTAVGATKPTYITAWPGGATQPTVSNLNVNNANPVPNLAIVPVGAGGVVNFFNAGGTVNLIGDVAGYFIPSTGARYSTTGPCRVFDSRLGGGNCSGAAAFPAGPIAAGGVLKVKVAGVGGVPSTATAVVINLTAVGATKSTYVTAWADGSPQPTVSNLNVNNANAVPNLAIVPVGADGSIDLFNAAGSVNLIGDVAGYFAP
jgi:hypothetical protein